MPLERLGFIDLPPHVGKGGFDHADVHEGSGRVYVAHTANDAVDVVDLESGRYLRSIEGLPGVAGALVSGDLVFSSNRGENTLGLIGPQSVDKVSVGRGPNGLAFDPGRGLLLAANVGEPPSVSLVDVAARREIARLPMPGRTRWAVFDPARRRFLVNIADPPRIVTIEDGHVTGEIEITSAGPHGLDLDEGRRRLFCACDGGEVFCLDADSGAVIARGSLTGPPDVVFLDPSLQLLYIATGDPGGIDVFDAYTLQRIEFVPTEPGAHTLAFDPPTHRVFAFLPRTHRAAVFLPASVSAV